MLETTHHQAVPFSHLINMLSSAHISSDWTNDISRETSATIETRCSGGQQATPRTVTRSSSCRKLKQVPKMGTRIADRGVSRSQTDAHLARNIPTATGMPHCCEACASGTNSGSSTNSSINNSINSDTSATAIDPTVAANSRSQLHHHTTPRVTATVQLPPKLLQPPPPVQKKSFVVTTPPLSSTTSIDPTCCSDNSDRWALRQRIPLPPVPSPATSCECNDDDGLSEHHYEEPNDAREDDVEDDTGDYDLPPLEDEDAPTAIAAKSVVRTGSGGGDHDNNSSSGIAYATHRELDRVITIQQSQLLQSEPSAAIASATGCGAGLRLPRTKTTGAPPLDQSSALPTPSHGRWVVRRRKDGSRYVTKRPDEESRLAAAEFGRPSQHNSRHHLTLAANRSCRRRRNMSAENAVVGAATLSKSDDKLDQPICPSSIRLPHYYRTSRRRNGVVPAHNDSPLFAVITL